jgi:hypothetical protein
VSILFYCEKLLYWLTVINMILYEERLFELDRKLTYYKLRLFLASFPLPVIARSGDRQFRTRLFFNLVSAKCRIFRTFTLLYSYLTVFYGMQVLTAMVIKSSTFWDIVPCSQQVFQRDISPPSSRLKNSQAKKKHTLRLPYSTMKIQATYSSKTCRPIEFHRTRRLYIPEDWALCDTI